MNTRTPLLTLEVPQERSGSLVHLLGKSGIRYHEGLSYSGDSTVTIRWTPTNERMVQRLALHYDVSSYYQMDTAGRISQHDPLTGEEM